MNIHYVLYSIIEYSLRITYEFYIVRSLIYVKKNV